MIAESSRTASAGLGLLLALLLILCPVRARTDESSEAGIDFASYHDYAALEHLFKKLERDFPSLAKLHSIGKSVRNRELYVLQVRYLSFQVKFLSLRSRLLRSNYS